MSLFDLFRPSRREARRQIEERLLRGVLTLDEIASQVELEFEEKLGEGTVRALVDEAWKRRSRIAPARPTALDRLQAVFDSLDALGIMARHYPTAGRSDAESWIRDELAVAKQQGKSYRGYCYYDQHLVEMMSGGMLGFCFGPVMPPTTYAQFWGEQARVGKAVVDALEAAGFKVEWSGRAADTILIGEISWSGPRDQAGTPLVPIGPRLESRAPRRHGNESVSPPITNVFVSCANGRPDAHRLIAAISSKTGEQMYGGLDTFDSLPAAVAFTTPAGSVLDFVAGESTPGPRGMLACRDLASECSFLVAVTPTIGELETEWWTWFSPENRVLVLTAGGQASVHEGSTVRSIDLASGDGVTELLDAVAAAMG